MDRGAALNCRVVHNWNEGDSVIEEKNQQNVDGAEDGSEDDTEEETPTKK